jgi:hypothetical protein
MMDLVYEIFISYSCSYFICRKILRCGAFGFTSSLKEGVLWVFIAVTKSIASAEFEPMNLGYSGKHTNHYTT